MDNIIQKAQEKLAKEKLPFRELEVDQSTWRTAVDSFYRVETLSQTFKSLNLLDCDVFLRQSKASNPTFLLSEN